MRLWQMGHSGDTDWRASLENPHTHELLSFNSLEALFEYLYSLQQQMAGPAKAARPDDSMPSAAHKTPPKNV